MTSPARAVVGIPAYNHASKLRETLESLLLQTCPDFRVIVSDDNSTDETATIVAEYAQTDDRVVYRRSEQRLGYIGNARRCFELARKLFPEADFFSWGSDHDVWHPLWLATLMDALDKHPEAVLACPHVYRIDGDGHIFSTRCADVATLSIAPPLRRFAVTFSSMSAGNMVYGLMRADALDKVGVLAWQLLPDRLLLSELALWGPMITVPEYLWFRRYRGLASIDRQISASFFATPPSYLKLPWWMAHTGHIFRRYVWDRGAEMPISQEDGIKLTALYFLLSLRLVFRRWFRRRTSRAVKAVSQLIRIVGRAVRAGVNAIPGQPHRYFRPLYVPFCRYCFSLAKKLRHLFRERERLS